MRHFIYLFFTLVFFTACNDGDILEVGLEFDKILEFCDQSTTTYLVYDTKQNPNESLSLLFPRNAATALIFAPAVSGRRDSLTINGSTVRFNYRTYNGNPSNLLCQLVPDASTMVINDYEAPSGTVYTTTTFVDDDEDEIPSSVEDMNLDGDDDPSTNPTDRDGDGIPDYQDADDDNDNVLTRLENPNYSEENSLTQAQDTDGDGVPDYLDDDDDGDDILTRYEDEGGDLNPTNDFDEATLTPDSPPRYLDILADESFQDEIDMLVIQFVPNIFKRNYTVDFQLVRLDLQILSTDAVDLGKYKYFAIRERP
jgi:hypothetical protein